MTTPNGTAYTVLAAAEARTAGALFERMFPADERGPGARDIGVVEYVDRALYGHDKRLVPAYKLILAAVEAACESAHGRGFADLPPPEQDEIVRSLAEGRLPGPFDESQQAAIFEQLRAHLQE